MPSFSDLLKIHRDLDEVFMLHQHALLHFDFEHAGELLSFYAERLEEHMSFEEEKLLPVYAERATIERGGEVKLFLDEHEKMKNFVQMFVETTENLKSETAPENPLLALLDREFFYLKLCSHHDTREARYLYPGLDAVTSDEERSAVLSQLSDDSDD